MAIWYKGDPRRWSLGLIWARSPGLLGFLLQVVALKVLRLSPPPIAGFALDRELPTIELDQAPAEAQEALRSMIAECTALGFRLAQCHTIEFIGDADGYAAHLLHANGRIRALAIRSRALKTVESGCALVSRLQDGAIYSTSNLPRSSDLPRVVHSASYPGASIAEIFSRHQDRLGQFNEEVVARIAVEQLRDEFNELRRRMQTHAIARGALTPMTSAEIERLTIVTAELAPEPSGNPFRSPLADEVVTAPRRPSVWWAVFNGAICGFALGAIVGLTFASKPRPELNVTLWEKGAAILRIWGWQPLPALAGGFLGWLSWRRAKRRAARPSSSDRA
jgi:hypothetical protein